MRTPVSLAAAAAIAITFVATGPARATGWTLDIRNGAASAEGPVSTDAPHLGITCLAGHWFVVADGLPVRFVSAVMTVPGNSRIDLVFEKDGARSWAMIGDGEFAAIRSATTFTLRFDGRGGTPTVPVSYPLDGLRRALAGVAARC